MGTMWNTNLIIDNRGNLLGKHHKIMPTFAEKMIWSRGDGSGLRVWETELGRIGTLACGNNTHCLYKYALIAQGEQIHVANYPAFNVPEDGDVAIWNLIRNGCHSLEGKLFNLCSSSTLNDEMVDMLCGKSETKRKWMANCRSYSSITNPLGNTLAELTDEDGIVYAGIDISEMITAKQFHDIIGHYTRMDVVSLNLCQDEDQPIHYATKIKKDPAYAETDWELIKNLQENQKELTDELQNVKEAILKMR